ncbi:hypothetical protein FB451DRAFT_1415906 [Mycena latifolia]|nr:hypothetical protein FB451DRAFT_1415906 [Mycena latifolia]
MAHGTYSKPSCYSPEFAQELIEVIVGEVLGRENLKACSLVSKAFVASSQQELFRSLCLHANAADNPDLFNMSPHLVRYVNGLTLYVDRGADFELFESVVRQLSGRLKRLDMFSLFSTFPGT